MYLLVEGYLLNPDLTLCTGFSLADVFVTVYKNISDFYDWFQMCLLTNFTWVKLVFFVMMLL